MTAWAYEGPAGPEHWSSLDEAYSPCGGRAQSPVDITGQIQGGAGPLVFSYGTPANVARNNGMSVHVDYPAGNTLVSGGGTYGLLSMHMHAPSEHTVEGEQLAAELHLVHADADGSLAVVGLLFALGEADPGVQALLDAAPPPNQTVDEGIAIDPTGYLTTDAAYYRYGGSLTTPPCSEGVAWHVMREVGTVSAAQAEALRAIGGGPTNRPVQPLHGRAITLEGAT